jgi:hypothetical protein
MPFAASINFRGSSGWVTDASGQTYCLGDAYPTTRAGLTFGWGGFTDIADRDNAAPSVPEFAGINYRSDAAGSRDFRLDLPGPGSYAVRLAIGDAAIGQTDQYCRVLDSDGTTVLATPVAGAAVGTGQYWDASGVLRADATAWRASNAPATVTITGDHIFIRIADPAGAGYTTIAHLEVAGAGGGGTPARPPGLLHHARPLLTRVS